MFRDIQIIFAHFKTYCPYWTSPCVPCLLTDRQITLARITPRPSATPPTAPSPVYRWTDYICSRSTATPSCNWCLEEGHPGGCLESSPKYNRKFLSLFSNIGNRKCKQLFRQKPFFKSSMICTDRPMLSQSVIWFDLTLTFCHNLWTSIYASTCKAKYWRKTFNYLNSNDVQSSELCPGLL